MTDRTQPPGRAGVPTHPGGARLGPQGPQGAQGAQGAQSPAGRGNQPPGAYPGQGQPAGAPWGPQEHRDVWTPYRSRTAGPPPAPGQTPAAAQPPGPPGPMHPPGYQGQPGYPHGQPPAWDQAGGSAWPSGGPGSEPRGPQPAGGDRDEQWAMFAYLGAIFTWLVAPALVYLLKHRSLFVRQHAAQSCNLAVTGTLFAVSIGIVGGLLALDSTRAALLLMVPLLVTLWIVVMVYLIRAASAASRGEFFEIPAWICVPLLR